MTITHRGGEVFKAYLIPEDDLPVLLGEGFRSVNLNLIPNPEDPLEDRVTISSKYGNGSREVKGPKINWDYSCRKEEVGWHNERDI